MKNSSAWTTRFNFSLSLCYRDHDVCKITAKTVCEWFKAIILLLVCLCLYCMLYPQIQELSNKAAARFDKANSQHTAAKEMIRMSESHLSHRTMEDQDPSSPSPIDLAWQEMLNHATTKVRMTCIPLWVLCKIFLSLLMGKIYIICCSYECDQLCARRIMWCMLHHLFLLEFVYCWC